MLLPARARREVQRILVAAAAAIAKGERPQSADGDIVAAAVLQGPHQCARSGIVSIDQAIAEIPHQQVVGELAEGGRSDGQAPRRIQQTARAPHHQRLEQFPGRIEDVDVAIARGGNVQLLVDILFGIGHIEFAAEVLDVERRETRWYGRIGKGATGWSDRVELSVENIDPSSFEVSGIELHDRRGDEREALVNRGRRVVLLDKRLSGSSSAGPGGEYAILRRKDPTRRHRGLSGCGNRESRRGGSWRSVGHYTRADAIGGSPRARYRRLRGGVGSSQRSGVADIDRVHRRKTRASIAHPERTGGRGAKPPRVYQAGIDEIGRRIRR